MFLVYFSTISAMIGSAYGGFDAFVGAGRAGFISQAAGGCATGVDIHQDRIW